MFRPAPAAPAAAAAGRGTARRIRRYRGRPFFRAGTLLLCFFLPLAFAPACAGTTGPAEESGRPTFSAAADDPTPPAQPVRLVFIHHSCGENWLKDSDGGLGKALRDNNYYVSDTNYGWGPNGIGDRTDIGNWWEWFRGPDSPTYLAALYAESGQHSSYSRLPTDPGGENTVIMFKSCFPNSNLKGNPSDPVPDIDHNPLKGQDCWSPHHTVANAKGIYLDLLEYFKTRQDKLFVVVTAPPVQDPTWAANARAFNNWLVNDWLDGYPYNNVFVFDFYNVLTSNGGDPYTSDAGWESGNHHRWWNNAVQHKTDGGSDTLAYPSGGDDHPNYAGNRKATAEFVDLLNVAYNRFMQGNPSAPHIDTVTPSSGAVGTEVTVEGTGFGAARGDSRVEFEGTAAVDYLEWSDTRIRCRVPAGALSGWLKVVTGRGSSNGFNFVVPLSRVETTFYFAEGYTGRGFDEWLCIMNREGTPAVAQVNYLFADGSPPFVKDYPVPGDARVTVNVNAEIGTGKEVSVKIESDGAVLAERPMYFDYQGVVSGGHDVVGVESPSTTWYFAEGYTGPGFDQYVCVLNPGDDAADLTFRFQTEEAGEVIRDGFRVPPRSRRTFKANDLLGAGYQFSLVLQSTRPVTAERPVYFTYTGRSAVQRRGGHCVTGSSSLHREYYFAEGTTRNGFESWLTLQNPNSTRITVQASFQVGEGQGDPVERSYAIEPKSRKTVFIADEVGPEKDVSVKLSGSAPFLAERPMYFSYSHGGLAVEGGHCVVGTPSPGTEWLFAEGYTGPGFDQWLCLQNPGESRSTVRVRYYTQEAGALAEKTVVVPGRTRLTLMVNQHAGTCYQLSVRLQVTSGPGIVAERPMYFDYGPGRKGGHDVVGETT